jgi:hypothetical protein
MTKKMTEEGNGRAIGIAMLIGSMGMIALCLMCIVALVKCVPSENVDTQVDTTKVVVYDTIPYYQPTPVDSIVTKTIIDRVRVADTTIVSDTLTCVVYDSIDVELPIAQKHYEDSTYSAWVSGYNPALDSIYVYPRTEIQTITIHTTERKRWSIGVSGGLGVVWDGTGWHCGPGVNMGVVYSF